MSIVTTSWLAPHPAYTASDPYCNLDPMVGPMGGLFGDISSNRIRTILTMECIESMIGHPVANYSSRGCWVLVTVTPFLLLHWSLVIPLNLCIHQTGRTTDLDLGTRRVRGFREITIKSGVCWHATHPQRRLDKVSDGVATCYRTARSLFRSVDGRISETVLK